jgi:poly(hydroxyalkanoate) granule-associated protein
MAKKPDSAAPASGMPDLSGLNTHQIWLAGLGAMAQAQAQGNKAFETLVSDGLAFQRKSQEEAQQRFEEATERFASMAQGLGQQATGRIDKLEHVFEERVARALHRLGMPTLQDIADLQARVADLEARAGAASQPAARPAAKTSKTPARKTTRKA